MVGCGCPFEQRLVGKSSDLRLQWDPERPEPRMVQQGGGGDASVNQVWSLTQFYSVDFSKSRISVKKCIFKNEQQSGFASAVFDGILGPLRLVRHI